MTRTEVMEELQQNTLVDVIIATAGSGSRMATVNNDLHKALLPYDDKPILWHIIQQIPAELRIGILLGHKANQIKDFLAIAFPERKFEYIPVDDWTSARSGTAYSLLCARNFVKEQFWYLPCDGIFNQEIFNLDISETTFFFKPVAMAETSLYATFYIEENRITQKFHKVANVDNAVAFTGIMKITNPYHFFELIRKSATVEFTEAIELASLTLELETWKDLGNVNSYYVSLNANKLFDFTKTDEFTFILPSKIVKWWPEISTPVGKLIKPQANPTAFPENILARGEFLSYDKASGSSMYDSVSEESFGQLLIWLDRNLWKREEINLTEDCRVFYREKTLMRLELMKPILETKDFNPIRVNGVVVKDWNKYLKEIDWATLISDVESSVIHGDLQFDNIIFSKRENLFTLIDWRPTFGTQQLFGDIYYDLAKLLGGIRLNYLEVKQNRFNYSEFNGEIELTIPKAPHADSLEFQLKTFVQEKNLNFEKVLQLVPIIYWNMAPLHKKPFNRFLWCLGLYNFAKNCS